MANKSYIFYLLIGISGILLMLDRFGMVSGIRDTSDVVIIPVKTFLFTIKNGTRNSFEIITHYDQIRQFAKQQDRYKQETEELTFSLNQLQEENKQLREQLHAQLPSKPAYIPANVMTVNTTMELSAGERDGLRLGMPVVSGISLVGKISVVSARRATVQLLTDPDITITARTSRGTEGIITGQPGTTIKLGKVLQKDPLFLEDVVTTAGDAQTPPNLLVGKIVHIDANDVDVYKQAKIQSPLKYDTLRTVFVIKNP